MKMKPIYEAEDGTRFDSEIRCQEYEQLCERVKVAISPLGETLDVNSMEYYQHNPAKVSLAWEQFIALCRPVFGDFAQNVPAHEIHPASYAGRILSECGSKCMSEAGYRFHKIDAEGREFDQPYWAHHRGDKTLGGHRQINP